MKSHNSLLAAWIRFVFGSNARNEARQYRGFMGEGKLTTHSSECVFVHFGNHYKTIGKWLLKNLAKSYDVTNVCSLKGEHEAQKKKCVAIGIYYIHAGWLAGRSAIIIHVDIVSRSPTKKTPLFPARNSGFIVSRKWQICRKQEEFNELLTLCSSSTKDDSSMVETTPITHRQIFFLISAMDLAREKQQPSDTVEVEQRPLDLARNICQCHRP
jgi:hypothetical protein